MNLKAEDTMSLYRNFYKDTRSLMIASASGLFLFSQFAPINGAEPIHPPAYHQSSRTSSLPRLTKLTEGGSHPLLDVADGRVIQVQHVNAEPAESRVDRLYGSASQAPQTINPAAARPIAQPQQIMYPQTTAQTQQSQVSQTAGTRVPRKSLFDRLVGRVRGDSNIPAGPPQDPGFQYPTASDASRQTGQRPQQFAQQPQQGTPKTAPSPAPANTFVPPPVPGVENNPPVVSQKPRLFPTQESASPIDALETREPAKVAIQTPPPAPGSRFIPPMPDSDEFIGLKPAEKDDVASQQLPEVTPQKYPELKNIMEGKPAVVKQSPVVIPPAIDEKPVKQPAEVVATKTKKSLPVIDLNSSLPKLEAVLKAEKEKEKERQLAAQPVQQPEKLSAPQVANAAPVNELAIPAPAELNVPAVESTPTPQPAPMVALEVKPSAPAPALDPLANPFPEDVAQETTEEVIQPKSMPAETPDDSLDLGTAVASSESSSSADVKVEEELLSVEDDSTSEAPYTGLSLESDLFLNAKMPAPAEPSTMAANSPGKLEEPGIASLDSTEIPDLPTLPIPELPGSTKTTQVEEAPETEASLPAEMPSVPAPAPPLVAPPVAEAPLQAPAKAPQLQAPEPKQRVAMNAPEIKPQVQQKTEQDTKQSKMELIASRKGMSGLKGFCPVELRDARDLVDTNEQFSAIFNDKEYSFSSEEALERFIDTPEKYAPASRGSDVIHLSLTGEELEGSLDFAVWYKGRLYLFTSAETMETFVAAPSSHSTNL